MLSRQCSGVQDTGQEDGDRNCLKVDQDLCMLHKDTAASSKLGKVLPQNVGVLLMDTPSLGPGTEGFSAQEPAMEQVGQFRQKEL